MNFRAAVLCLILFYTSLIILSNTDWDSRVTKCLIFGVCILGVFLSFYTLTRATSNSDFGNTTIEESHNNHNTQQNDGDIEAGHNNTEAMTRMQIVNSSVRSQRQSSSHHDHLHLLSFFPRAHIASLAITTLPPVVSFSEDQTTATAAAAAPHASQRDCSICMEAFRNGDLIQPFGVCLHEFHSTCINSWLFSGKTTCPICRKELCIRIF